jgi:hypothetical protein
MTKFETARRSYGRSPSTFDIRHSCFVIFFDSAFIQRVEDRLLFRSNFLPDKYQLCAIGLKWLQLPAAGDEIEKLRVIGEADETLGANHACRQPIYQIFEISARKDFA